MSAVVVYGSPYSSYVRTVRMTLLEKGVEHRLENVDRSTDEYRMLHPFAKIPAFEHDGFRMYETAAICRYVDEALPGPPLQPMDAKARARMAQVIGVADAYLYPCAVLRLLIPRFLVPMRGGTPDEETIAAAVPDVRYALGVLEGLLIDDYLGGEALSLADLHVLPIAEGLLAAPERDAVFADARRLARWALRMGSRPSAVETRPQLPPEAS